MPLKISDVGKILKTINRFEGIGDFNETLPLKIEIKKQLNEYNYLINLGNKREIVSKSFVKLKPGKYFAIIKEFGNNIKITNLKEFPKILDLLEKINFNFQKDSEKTLTKETILHHLANATTKNEFIFFTNLLLALERKIYHLITEKRKSLIQFQYKKNKITFYAVFNHLGELEGEIYLNKLIIYSPFENTLNLIKEYSDTIHFEVITILKKEIKPLFEFKENLLNLKA